MSEARYDLISINGYDAPDVKKGTVTVTPMQKYNEYEGEDGGKVIEIIAEGMLQGSVSYNGLLQSQIQAIMAVLRTVSTMTIYNPHTGNMRTFYALITVSDTSKIIHDQNGNAWSWGFTFEEIGSVT